MGLRVKELFALADVFKRLQFSNFIRTYLAPTLGQIELAGAIKNSFVLCVWYNRKNIRV